MFELRVNHLVWYILLQTGLSTCGPGLYTDRSVKEHLTSSNPCCYCGSKILLLGFRIQFWSRGPGFLHLFLWCHTTATLQPHFFCLSHITCFDTMHWMCCTSTKQGFLFLSHRAEVMKPHTAAACGEQQSCGYNTHTDRWSSQPALMCLGCSPCVTQASSSSRDARWQQTQ